MPSTVLRNFQIPGYLSETPTGPEAQAGDTVRLYLNQTANPGYPEFITGIIEPPIQSVGVMANGCGSPVEGRSYNFRYNTDDLGGGVLTACDVIQVAVVNCCVRISAALDEEIETREGQFEELQEQLDSWDVIQLQAEPTSGAAGQIQIIKQTAGGSVITGGTFNVVVTKAGMTGSPLAIPVTVVSGDSAVVVAAKAAATLAANATIAANFEVDNIGADFSLATKVEAANDGTFNMAITAGTSVGPPSDTTADVVQAGVAPVAGDTASRIGQHAQWGDRIWEATEISPVTRWVEILTEWSGAKFLLGVNGWLGGTDADLNGQLLGPDDVGREIFFRDSGGGLWFYQAEQSTAAQDNPTVIRPLNYDPVTNPYLWSLSPVVTVSGSVIDSSTGGNANDDGGRLLAFESGGSISITNSITIHDPENLGTYSLGISSFDGAMNIALVQGANLATFNFPILSSSRSWNLPDYSGNLALDRQVAASVPVTAFAITAGAKLDQFVSLTPAGTLATGTFSLPTAANSRVGQKVTLFSSQIVTALTVNVTGGGTLRGTAITTIAANASYEFICESVAGSGIWVRVR